MTEIFIFLTSVTGLTLILNKSHLFKPLREFITRKDNRTVLDVNSPKYGSKKFNFIWWFLNSLFTCSTCLSVWLGFMIYGLSYKTVDLNLFLYAFSASLVTTLLVSLIQYLDRK